MPEPALIVEELDKTFRIPKQHSHTMKERALHPLRSVQYREFPVLRNISFEIGRGEFFGIVGRNGSGKSTLLKCMAGIYRPDRGSVSVAGRLAPFIELGVGFNPDLTAMDNVVINGVMMGLSRREARRRFDEVIEFAELEDFLELKLKNYSSGMQVRLAFAVMIQASADVLLIDEVLAVGDAAFQQKCLDVFYRLRDEGRTIVLVTHDMSSVERFCHRAMFIENGDIRMIGDPVEVGHAYLAANFDTGAAETVEPGERREPEARWEVWLEDADGARTTSVPSGEPLRVRVDLEVLREVERPRLHVLMRDAEQNVLTGTEVDLGTRTAIVPDQPIHIDCDWRATFGAGHYFVGLALTRGAAESDIVIDDRTAAEVFVHSAARTLVGYFEPATDVHVSDHDREQIR